MLYAGSPATLPPRQPQTPTFHLERTRLAHASSTGRKLEPRAARPQPRAARLEARACPLQLQPGIGRGDSCEAEAGGY